MIGTLVVYSFGILLLFPLLYFFPSCCVFCSSELRNLKIPNRQKKQFLRRVSVYNLITVIYIFSKISPGLKEILQTSQKKIVHERNVTLVAKISQNNVTNVKKRRTRRQIVTPASGYSPAEWCWSHPYVIFIAGVCPLNLLINYLTCLVVSRIRRILQYFQQMIGGKSCHLFLLFYY